MAAVTTSIPEAPNTQHQLGLSLLLAARMLFFVVRALNSLSEVGTMEDHRRWLRDVAQQRHNAPPQTALVPESDWKPL